MSRVTRREWYSRVNNEWPYEDFPNGQLPELTMPEAIRATRKLYRFVRRQAWPKPWKTKWTETSGNRYNHARRGVLNPSKGWHALIHHLSHWFVSDHGAEHARMERRLIKEVVRRGWLGGVLKSEAKETIAVRLDEVISAKLQHAEQMMKRAATRAKRAATILTKWRKKVRYYEKHIAAISPKGSQDA